MTEQIMMLLDEINLSQKKMLYLGAIKSFGREDGRVIYQALKAMN